MLVASISHWLKSSQPKIFSQSISTICQVKTSWRLPPVLKNAIPTTNSSKFFALLISFFLAILRLLSGTVKYPDTFFASQVEISTSLRDQIKNTERNVKKVEEKKLSVQWDRNPWLQEHEACAPPPLCYNSCPVSLMPPKSASKRLGIRSRLRSYQVSS